jgi:hypothetical protein
MAWKRDKKSVEGSYKAWYSSGEYKSLKAEYDKNRRNDPVIGEKIRRSQKETYWGFKRTFFKMYGEICACCGETTKEFLTMEHKNGLQGLSRHRGMAHYKHAINEYRPDLYETLCMNCNHAFGRVGYCPHNPKRRVKE